MLSEVQQTADHIGIIAGGVLGYEGKLNANENLEQLFMDVVKIIAGRAWHELFQIRTSKI